MTTSPHSAPSPRSKTIVRAAYATAVALSVAAPCEFHAQQVKRTVEVRDEVACATCSITVTTLRQLPVTDGSGLLTGPPLEIQQDALNRYWVVPAPSGSPIVFDSAGKFVASIGRAGRGPGEFVGPCLVRFLGDSAIVMDQGNHRISILDMNLRVARSYTTNTFGSDVVPISGGLVATGPIRTPTGTGLPLHLLDLSQAMAPIRSFGARRENWRSATPTSLEWRIAPGTTQQFWTSDLDDYRIVGWSAPGVDVVEFIRKPEWFPERSPVIGGGSRTPPPPYMRDLVEDAEGLLWIVGLSASKRWREAWAESMGGGAKTAAAGTGDIPVRVASIPSRRINLEVLDPKAARVVVRLTLDSDERLVGLLPGKRAALYSEDAIGNPRLRIAQFEISRR